MNLKKLLGVTLLLTPMLGVNDVYASRRTYKVNSVPRDTLADNPPDGTTSLNKNTMSLRKNSSGTVIEKVEEGVDLETVLQPISDKDWADAIKTAERLKIEAITSLNDVEIKEKVETETLKSYTELFKKSGGNVLKTYFSLMVGAVKLGKVGYRQKGELLDDFQLPVMQLEATPDVYYTIDRNSFMGIVNSYVDYCKKKSIDYRESFRNLSASDPGDAIVLSPAITLDAPNSLLNWVEPITNDKIQRMEQKIVYVNSLEQKLQQKTDASDKNVQKQLDNIKIDLQNKLGDVYTKDEIGKITDGLQEAIQDVANQNTKLNNENTELGVNIKDITEALNEDGNRINDLEGAIAELKKQFLAFTSAQRVNQPQFFQPIIDGNKVAPDVQTSVFQKKNNNSKNPNMIFQKKTNPKSSSSADKDRARNISTNSNESSNGRQTKKIISGSTLKIKNSSVGKSKLRGNEQPRKDEINEEEVVKSPNNFINIPNINKQGQLKKLNNKKINLNNIKGDSANEDNQVIEVENLGGMSSGKGGNDSVTDESPVLLAGAMTEEEFLSFAKSCGVGNPPALVKSIKRSIQSGRLNEISENDSGFELARKLGISGNINFKNRAGNEKNLSGLRSLFFKK